MFYSCFCLSLSATTADRFYRIDRAQVSLSHPHRRLFLDPVNTASKYIQYLTLWGRLSWKPSDTATGRQLHSTCSPAVHPLIAWISAQAPVFTAQMLPYIFLKWHRLNFIYSVTSVEAVCCHCFTASSIWSLALKKFWVHRLKTVLKLLNNKMKKAFTCAKLYPQTQDKADSLSFCVTSQGLCKCCSRVSRCPLLHEPEMIQVFCSCLIIRQSRQWRRVWHITLTCGSNSAGTEASTAASDCWALLIFSWLLVQSQSLVFNCHRLRNTPLPLPSTSTRLSGFNVALGTFSREQVKRHRCKTTCVSSRFVNMCRLNDVVVQVRGFISGRNLWLAWHEWGQMEIYPDSRD